MKTAQSVHEGDADETMVNAEKRPRASETPDKKCEKWGKRKINANKMQRTTRKRTQTVL